MKKLSTLILEIYSRELFCSSYVNFLYIFNIREKIEYLKLRNSLRNCFAVEASFLIENRVPKFIEREITGIYFFPRPPVFLSKSEHVDVHSASNEKIS